MEPNRNSQFSSSLVVKAYTTDGQAAKGLHAMAILQVYQAKALKNLEAQMQELHAATDLALQATEFIW